jgi:hypothetical protein
MRDVVVIRARPGASAEPLLARTLEILDGIYQGEGPRDHEIWRRPRVDWILIQSTLRGTEPVPMHQARREAFAYTGFVSAARSSASRVRKLFSPASGGLVADDSPGGIAAFFLVDARKDRCFAWSSHAGVEGVFHTKGEACVAIGNRPLVSHLVGTQRDAPRFSGRWARRVLLGGSSVWDDTPFEGTFQPPPRTTLVLDGDEVRHAPHPVALQRRHHRDRDPAGVKALNAAAEDAVSVLRRWPRGELQLSGGKDSRYVGALLRHAGIDADHVTHGRTTGGESVAAAAVAAALGVELRITPGDIVMADDLLPTILSNLRATDGLLSENRQLAYREEGHERRPLIQGQAHHPRGGFRALAKVDRPAMTEHLIALNLGDPALVSPALVTERRARLQELLDGYEVQRPAELAYWMYNDWRMTRWTIASHRWRARSRHVVWPMMDERVLRVISELSPFDRLSEVAFFAALSRLSPAVAAVPLFEKTWKFDSGVIGEKEFPDHIEARRQPFKEGPGGGSTYERRLSTIRPLFRMAIHDLRYGAELRELIDPAARDVLENHPDPATALGQRQIQLVQFMWKALAVALVMEGDWLRAPAPS